MDRVKRWCMVAGLVLAAGALPARADLTVGATAPDLVLHALDGHDYSVAGLRGKVVIVTFWASWCEPCRAELPRLSQFARQHAAQGVVVLGFALDGTDSLPQVRAMAASLSFPVGLLGSAWAGEYGRIWRIPVSFVIDRSGRLVYDGWKDSGQPIDDGKLSEYVVPVL